MRIAFLTDIHANLEALRAVLRTLEDRGYDKLVILGDLVDYGPDPVAVIEIVARLTEDGAVCIRGNHDEATWVGAAGMVDSLRIVVDWTVRQLDQSHIAFLKSLPMQFADEDRLYVHASAAKPDKWYYINSLERAKQCLDHTSARLVFVGHTHVPAIFIALPDRPPIHFKPQRDMPVPLSALRRAVCVVGSVGQPRDGIAAACFGLLDTKERTITMMRAPYDHAETVVKIRKAGLPIRLGERLASGR